ncbi:hypothetical protein HNR02_002669 [Amycolatopsis endophytica]|uniref:Uncharacterized protein n=1 Tax=Amycolatopsis endophytica TaxID=860233 RepID=A0A853B3Y5_9PSEU|nr:hypothetical protein [Amycolatopsis endophytica]
MRNRDWIDGDDWYCQEESKPGGLSTFDPHGPQRAA